VEHVLAPQLARGSSCSGWREPTLPSRLSSVVCIVRMDLVTVWNCSASFLGPLSPPSRQAGSLQRERENKFLQYCSMLSPHRPVEGSGLVTGFTPRDGGLPKRISKGLMFTVDLFLILICIRTIGRAFVHGSPVSSQHLANFYFRVSFSYSVASLLAGCYTQCCLRLIVRNSLIWVIAELTR